MKISYVIPHSFEEMYSNEISNMKYPEKFHDIILKNRISAPNNYCKASNLLGLKPTLYYLTSINKEIKTIVHKYGHIMKSIPINIKKGYYGEYGWEYSYYLLKQLKYDCPDIVVVTTYILNAILPFDMYDIISIYCKKNNIPLIARHGANTAECSILNGKVKLYYHQLIKGITLSLADKIIVPSKKEYILLKKYYKISSKKLVYLKDPVNLENFYNINKIQACIQINKNPDKTYLLYVGRFDIDKGIQNIINIMPYLIKEYKNIELLLVGFGPYLNYFKKLIYQKNISDYVSFEGYISHDILKYYYNVAEVFLLPSYHEGTPAVVQEAIACNTNTIATNVGGIPDILSDDVGIIIPPNNDSLLRKKIEYILDGNFLINQEKRNNLIKSWSMYSFGKKLKKILDEVIDKK